MMELPIFLIIRWEVLPDSHNSPPAIKLKNNHHAGTIIPKIMTSEQIPVLWFGGLITKLSIQPLSHNYI